MTDVVRTGAPAQPSVHVDLDISGMTCAACANRIEKKLNRLDGVRAAVNYATEKASVEFDPRVVATDELVAAVESIGYGAEVPRPEAQAVHDDDQRGLRLRFIISLVLAVPVVVWAMIARTRPDDWQWWSLKLAAPVVFWGGWPFHRVALRNARHRSASMDTLVSIGTLAAFAWSVYAVIANDRAVANGTLMPDMDMSSMDMGGTYRHVYFEVAAAVTVFILLGRVLEARAKRRAGDALRALGELQAKEVSVLHDDGHEERRPIDDLRPGMVFVVRPGEKLATDGIVTAGASAVDTSLITGESAPVEVSTGSEVVGSTVNVSGRLEVRATRVGADTKLAQITRLVAEAQGGKAPVQRLADRVAGVFVPIVIALSIATLFAWLLSGHAADESITAAVAVVIVACPCALGLATPTALMVGTGRAAQLGIIIRGPEILESTRRIDTVVLDKTGTVTTGVMGLAGVHVTGAEFDEAQALAWAGAVEAGSEHPIGKAIHDAALAAAGTATSPGASVPVVVGFRASVGVGVEADVDGRHVVIGRPESLTATLADARDRAEAEGHSVVAMSVDGIATAVFAVADQVKTTSAAAIEHLKSLGLKPVLLSGDREAAASSTARAVGIDEVIAGVMPDGKVAVIRSLQERGRVVAMVGDGVNDAAALAQADLGIAIGTGSDVAVEAGDLTLVGGDILGVATAIRLARRTLAVIKGNLFWAFAYNVAAIPLAAFGVVDPMIAGAAMAASSVFVVTNSLRLRRFTPQNMRGPQVGHGAAPASR
ncbi:MAG: heavy metal translocating P-type ATPase [Acidimicrobiia bacterium]